MFGSLFLLLTVVPALELYLLLNVGARLGAVNTLLVIVLTGIVGASLARSQGLSILARAQNEMAKGQIPTQQLAAGLCVFAGGLLLLTPGFLTDVLGLSLVFPLTRVILQSFFMSWISKMIQNGRLNVTTYGFGDAPRSPQDFTGFENNSNRTVPPEAGGSTFEAEYEVKKD